MTPEERARRVSDRMEEFCQRSRCEDCEKLVVDEINEAIRAAGERARKALDDRLVEVAAAAAATEREACMTDQDQSLKILEASFDQRNRMLPPLGVIGRPEVTVSRYAISRLVAALPVSL